MLSQTQKTLRRPLGRNLLVTDNFVLLLYLLFLTFALNGQRLNRTVFDLVFLSHFDDVFLIGQLQLGVLCVDLFIFLDQLVLLLFALQNFLIQLGYFLFFVLKLFFKFVLVALLLFHLFNLMLQFWYFLGGLEVVFWIFCLLFQRLDLFLFIFDLILVFLQLDNSLLEELLSWFRSGFVVSRF